VWGCTQEPTALLAALNHFRGARVEECGMLPLEAAPLHASPSPPACPLPSSLPPIGASPDAMLVWPDGSVEPLEVKNHSPFAQREGGGFELRDNGPARSVAPWHVPQLYLHMLCAGDGCASVVFLSASATRGANVFRLRRHPPLMRAILAYIGRFATQFGAAAAEPPQDFFWGEPEYARLLQLLQQTAAGAELVARIPEARMQRGVDDGPFVPC